MKLRQKKSKISINELKVIAKIINENYSNASSYTKDRNATFKGNSKDIVNKIIELKYKNKLFFITPNFSYNLKDIEEYLKNDQC